MFDWGGGGGGGGGAESWNWNDFALVTSEAPGLHIFYTDPSLIVSSHPLGYNDRFTVVFLYCVLSDQSQAIECVYCVHVHNGQPSSRQ